MRRGLAAVAVAALAACVLLAIRTCGADVPAPTDAASVDAPAATQGRPRPHAAVTPSVAPPVVEPPPVALTLHVTLPEGTVPAIEAHAVPARWLGADDEAEGFQPSGDAHLAPLTRNGAGDVRIDVAGAGCVLVVARAPGRAPAWRWVMPAALRTEAARIALAPVAGVSLAGTVRDEFGEPASGVDVVASPAGPEPVACDALCVRARTDAAGRFELRDLAPGTHRIWLRPPGGYVRKADDVRVPSVTEVDLRLVAGARIHGRVLDDSTGSPVPHARVALAEPESWPRDGTIVVAEASCDAQGRFDLRTGRPDASGARLIVDAEGWARFPVNDVVGRDAADWTDGADIEVEVRAARAAAVAGTVSGERGPAPGLLVRLSPKGPNSDDTWDGLWLTHTDAAGAFRLDRVRPGPFEVTVSYDVPDEIGGFATVTGEASPDEVARLWVRLDRASTARGRIVDAEGRAIEGALVTWSCGRPPGTTTSDADGRFELPLPDRADGGVDLAIRHPRWRAETVHVDGTPEIADDIVLQPVRPVRGRVLDDDGTPLAGARVLLVAGDPAQDAFLYHLDALATACTDDAGRFEIVLTDAGWPVLYAYNPHDGRWTSRSVEDDASTADVDLTFSSDTRIAGRVVDAADGRPLAGVAVRADFQTWRGPIVARTGADGRFDVRVDVRDHDAIRFECEGRRPALVQSSTLRLAAGDERRVAMERAFRVAGRVVDAKGRPLAGVSVVLNPGDPDASDWTRTDSAGRFAFGGLAAGRVAIVAEDDATGARAEVSVDAGATDVTLEPR